MSLALSSQPDNGFHFGSNYTTASTHGHAPRAPPEPWAAASATIGHLGAPRLMAQDTTFSTPQQHAKQFNSRSFPSPSGSSADLLAVREASAPDAAQVTISPSNNPPQDARNLSSFTGGAYGLSGPGDQIPTPRQVPRNIYTAGSINPNDLSSGQTPQPRSVLIRIAGDVGRYLAKQKPAPAPESSPSVAPHAISVVHGDEPTKGFSTDYHGWDKQPINGREPLRKDAHSNDPKIKKRTGWDRQGYLSAASEPAYTPTFNCQICGLEWHGALQFEDRSEGGKRKRQEMNMATTRPDAPLSWPDMLQYQWYSTSGAADPCLKGKTLRGHVHASHQPTGEDCCPPTVKRLRSSIQCYFDNCPFVDQSPAELRKHLHKRHWNYLEGLITRIQEKRTLDDCDRIVSHRAMVVFNGRDNAGKYKVSQPDRHVLPPEKITSPAQYNEHAEWIEYLCPPKLEKRCEYQVDEHGQTWRATYSMDPRGKRSGDVTWEPFDPETGQAWPSKKKRRTSR